MNGILLATGILVLLHNADEGPQAFPDAVATTVLTPYAGIAIMERRFEKPRPLRAWIVKIDLSNPNIAFNVTPKARNLRGFETAAATTLDFARNTKAELALNASPFAPVQLIAGQGIDIVGLAADNGDVYSQPVKDHDALIFDLEGNPRIVPVEEQRAFMPKVRDAVAGFKIILRDGKNLYARESEPKRQPVLHPRSAVGYSADHKTMIWVVIDGRQKGKSEGVSLFELGEIFKAAGASDALNLDGGGSTTLVLRDPKVRDWRVLNTPVGVKNLPGSLRQNGNSIGIQILGSDGDLTAEQLKAVMPSLTDTRRRQFLGPLNRAMTEAQIDNGKRRAAFLAQLAHESGELRYMEETASGDRYEGRKSLGNTEPGDGRRFKGRGPIQLTGRFNYHKAGQALGMDLENHPELVARPDIGCRVAAWFWTSRGLNQLADADDFRGITKRINGGYNGLAKREEYHQRALKALAIR